ncbi:MAG: HD domain-containing protein [Paramuribaculum sp.]|nr:HD domain-containing protein [Paramuribaculum sp.]
MRHDDYDDIIQQRADHVFQVMAPRATPDEMSLMRRAFSFAREAHKSQKRKTGEPYILHPIAVATIAAEELMLDANPVAACFLHDVVEDTDHTLEEISELFGKDVAFLVRVVTKQKKKHYEESKQVDNYRQMLMSVEYDIRAILVKLADRLHNMRTLSSMRADKQMKIAGETDYFYAPLATRLGLYRVKTELENLSFRFRCPHEFEELRTLIADDEAAQARRLARFAAQIRDTLSDAGIKAEVNVEYREPYSIWRKMHKYGDDFNHLKYRHFTDVIFTTPEDMKEKDMALKIYSVLTDRFMEKPGGIINYIDAPKENGYQSFHVKLLADFGRWQEVHISSERMVRDSKLGCVAERPTDTDTVHRWIEKFRDVLRDIAAQGHDGTNFIEKVVSSFYNDDIMIFTPNGDPVVLPQKSTIIDFAYEVNPKIAEHAKYARVNGFLASIKAKLRRGDVVEIFTDENIHPVAEWLDSCVSYKAKKEIREYLDSVPKPRYHRCPICNPIPGEEVVGFSSDPEGRGGEITLHKRDCKEAISRASQQGDSIVAVDFEPDSTLYPVTITVHAVDRFHLFVDLVDTITNRLGLSINSICTDNVDNIVTATINFAVHSADELHAVINDLHDIQAVDEVKYVADKQ